MFKLLEFDGYDQHGPHIFPLELGGGNRHIKLATEMHPEIARYIYNANKIPGKTQLLIDALGAGEWWGSNKNGDFFPEDQLSHRGKDYGFETFKHYAYPFKHHVNKDPEKAYGDRVILSAYQPGMHRVQLIVAVHDPKCQDILQRVDNGDFPDVSMGCRVPYDQCSICGNRAKNRSQYCNDLKWRMNKILPDGRKVMAINHRPKFFDISFVLIGAEKASKVLMKVASQNRGVVSSAELGEKHYGPMFWKGADFKNAAVQKKGTITKEVPMKVDSIKPVVESAPEIKSREPDLPPAVMKLLEGLPLSEIFSTLAFLGIDPKPDEFQKIVLIKSGQSKLAHSLERSGAVFRENQSATVDNPEQYFSIEPEHINEKLANVLRPTIPHRSCFNDFLIARLDKYASENPWYPEENKSSYLPVGPLAAGLAGLYAYMKNKSAEASMTKFEKAILRHPWLFGLLTAAGAGVLAGGINLLRPQPLGSLDTEYGTGYNPHYKTAASKKWLLPLSLGPLAYMYSGVQRSRAMRGERLGRFDRFIAQRPDIAAIVSMIGAPVAASKGANFVRHLKLGSIYSDFGMFSLTSGSKLLPAALIGAMVDATVAKKIGKIIDKRSKHGNPEGPAR